MKISLVIPFYNEKDILPETFFALKDFLEKEMPNGEVIFVSDGSSDGSSELLRSLLIEAGGTFLGESGRVESPEGGLFGIAYEKNRGKGNAVRVGMRAASGDILLFTDCDLAYGLDKVGEFIRIMSEGDPLPDLAIASRPLHPEGYEGYPFLRRLASKCYLLVLKCYGSLSVSDSQAGLKAFRREVYESLREEYLEDGFAFDFELLLLAEKKGYRICEVPAKVVSHRESKVSVLKDARRMLKKMREIKKRWK